MPLRVVKISIQHSQTYCLQVVSMLFTSAKYAIYECQVCCLRMLSILFTDAKYGSYNCKTEITLNVRSNNVPCVLFLCHIQ